MTILDTAISGMLVAQRALAVTSHNIANINTQGYSRQEIEVSARDANFNGTGFVGSGAEVGNIIRIHDQFLTNQLRSSVSGERETAMFSFLASRVDSMLADEQTALTASLQNFFNSVQDVSDLPSSIAARQVMLGEAESMVSRFQFLDARLSELSNEIRTQLSNNVREINTVIQGIAQINDRIVKARGQADGQSPNDLLDARDKMIQDLSAFVSVNAVEQFDGSSNVFIGNGQPLVLGGVPSSLSFSEIYKGHFDITLTSTFGTASITDNISGGSIGGVLNFQSQMLEPVRNSLGRLAIGLVDTFNSQHQLGRTLDGDFNLSFFTAGTPDVSPIGLAPNNVTATITDATALSDSDYSLMYNGGNAYTLTRLTDGQVSVINTGGASPFTTTPVDGFTITITAGAAVNDEYIIRPTINGARDMTSLISDPRKIAVAAPLRSAEATDASGVPTNVGNATMTPVDITTTTGIPLATPVTLTFDSAMNQFNVSAPPGGTLAYNPATESGGKQFSLGAVGDATFTIAGVPADGDQFVIENNANAAGDNQNGLKLTVLQDSPQLIGGTATYQDAYGEIVSKVGTDTRQNMISHEAMSALLDQAMEARESVSGVNLEEEAGNMLKFQQAFQAAARMVATADRVFQSLMESVR